MQNDNYHPKNVYLALMLLAILKILGLSDIVAGVSTALCYYMLWNG